MDPRILVPAMLALAADLPMEPQRRVTLKRQRKYDPRVALRYRIERRVRKAVAYRTQHNLPQVTEEEIRGWVAVEAQKLGLQLKEEAGEIHDHGQSPDDQS